MTYSLVTIREYGDPVEDRLYPDLNATASPEPIQLEPGDGRVREPWPATGLDVLYSRGGKLKSEVKLEDVRIDAFLTDGRTSLFCPKYDKGGGYSGLGIGLAVAAAANVASKARAARRSRGTALVGHLRHEWLIWVGGQDRRWIVPGSVRCAFQHGDTAGYLELSLPKEADPHAIALAWAQAAADHRLRHRGDLTDEQAGALRGVLAATKLRNEKNRYATHQLPGAVKVR